MTKLPDPPVPPECCTSGMPGMLVDMASLYDSEFFQECSGDEFKAAFALWVKAFTQRPAGSVPNNDKVLARWSLAGRRWPQVRDKALQGFKLCSDGRLYNKVVAQKALFAWQTKQRQSTRAKGRWEREKAAQAQANPEQTPTYVEDKPEITPTYVEANFDLDAANPLKSLETADAAALPGQMPIKEKEKEEKGEKATPSLSPDPAKPARGRAKPIPRDLEPEGFAEWYDAYPRHEGRREAAKVYAAAAKKAGGTDRLLELTKSHAFNPDRQFVPHAATWLRGERWLDQPVVAAGRVLPFPRPNGRPPSGGAPHPKPTAASRAQAEEDAIRARLMAEPDPYDIPPATGPVIDMAIGAD